MVTVLCTVRNCRLPLRRDERTLVCANGHAFDIARSGYVNLLQPQDRRSNQPGDSREAVAARRRFLEAGYEQPIVNAIVKVLRGALVSSPALDVACGDGFHLATIAAELHVDGHGVDIATSAIDRAARRHPALHWIVANADRFLPYADASFALVTSITGRMNPPEFRRVMRDDGRLLVAVTAADDLHELRAILHDHASERDRVARTVSMFENHFALETRERAETRARLDRSAIADLLASSYRGMRHREQEKLAGVDTLEVTLSRDLLLFRTS